MFGIYPDNCGLKNENLTSKERIKLGKTKGIGRWIYCKYCYKNVQPVEDTAEMLIICSECGYGLRPLY